MTGFGSNPDLSHTGWGRFKGVTPPSARRRRGRLQLLALRVRRLIGATHEVDEFDLDGGEELVKQLQESLESAGDKQSPRKSSWFRGVRDFFDDMKG